MYIQRERYLNRLIAKKDNGLIKVITGVRRCGKSFLLFTLYREHLLRSGIASDCIVTLALDNALNAKYRDPLILSQYLESRMTDEGKRYYIFLDEIQFVGRKKLQSDPDIFITFYDVLNGLLEKGNTDIYVTGSNSRMLSHDVATEFRGRGDELRLQPLCFKEYFDHVGGSREEALADYMLYGGMPLVLSKQTDAEKREYLSGLFAETYFKDIVERNKIAFPEVLGMLADELCSSVGSLTNSSKIADTLQSVRKLKIDSETIGAYLRYLTDCYLFSAARRYVFRSAALRREGEEVLFLSEQVLLRRPRALQCAAEFPSDRRDAPDGKYHLQRTPPPRSERRRGCRERGGEVFGETDAHFV